MQKTSYADYVNPHIGGIGHLLTATRPYVQRPHGAVRVAPTYTPGTVDVYLAPSIHGFPLGGANCMPDVGRDAAAPFVSGYDHDLNHITCYGGTIFLQDAGVRAEYTVGEHSLIYRFTFPAGREALLRICAQTVTCNGAQSSGHAQTRGAQDYFFAQMSDAPETTDAPDQGQITMRWAARASAWSLTLCAGLSYIDVDQAHDNLRKEAALHSLEELSAQTQAAWDSALGRVKVKGGTHDERQAFYTALYRVMGRMRNVSEHGRYFSPFDGCTHEDARPFYIDDGMWDTYRGAHPLQLLLTPSRHMDIVHSYLRMYEQCGHLPSFPHENGSLPVMLGKHTNAMIVDTYQKGLRDFDHELAYEAMVHDADQVTKLPWAHGPINAYDTCYFEKGFFPALPEGEEETLPAHPFERRQSVAVTLETAYDDHCLSLFAKALGKEEDAARFAARGQNYRTLYDARTGFMAPKTADGAWVDGFNPKLSGGQGGRAYFAECNAWVYTWHVQHDVPGLMQLMGGADAFCARLDQLFSEQYEVPKYTFLGQFPDATGLVGQYCMGNEPAFHIPYLYNYAGQPWKTQRRVRELMRLWFTNSPFGICGDEDGGAMSAWYAFCAIGLYTVCPGTPYYDIGSPLFDEITLELENGNTFTIQAPGQSAQHKYIQRATLNGKPLPRPLLHHDDILRGGTLELTMGLHPNTECMTGEA